MTVPKSPIGSIDARWYEGIFTEEEFHIYMYVNNLVNRYSIFKVRIYVIAFIQGVHYCMDIQILLSLYILKR